MDGVSILKQLCLLKLSVFALSGLGILFKKTGELFTVINYCLIMKYYTNSSFIFLKFEGQLRDTTPVGF